VSIGRFTDILLNSPGRGRLAAIVLAGFATALIIVCGSTWLTLFEERLGALGWVLNSDTSAEERITLVVVDEASIAETGAWPWDRATMGDLVTAIDDAGAQLQIHDIVYPEGREGDDEFVSALSRSRGAIIAQVPVLVNDYEAAEGGVLTHGIASGVCDSPAIDVVVASGYIAADAVFEKIPKGHNAAVIERDGGIRKSPALVCVDGVAYPSLALAAFMQLGFSSPWSVQLNAASGLLEPPAYVSIEGYPGLSIPIDETGAMRINFARSPNAFRAISASDVLAGRFDRDLLDNAWVLVGGTAFGLSDIVPTPYSGSAYGIELQARMLASVLDMSVPFSPNGAVLFQLILAACFATILYSASLATGKIPGYGLILLLAIFPASALALHIYALTVFGVWVGWLMPALFGVVAVASMQSYELAVARIERSRVYHNLTSYLSPMAAKEIAFALPSSQIDARRCDVTLISADIRNFAAFGESRPPEETAAILHYFNVIANETVESHGGKVAEFRGDSILAIWEGVGGSAAQDAFAAAEALQHAINNKLLPKTKLKGLEPMALGVGIDQGPVLIGSIGPSSRRSFSILGDTVSTTLRIQEMTAELSQPILVGAAVAKNLLDKNLQSQGSYLLPGLRVPHLLFAPPPCAEVIEITSNGSIASG